MFDASPPKLILTGTHFGVAARDLFDIRATRHLEAAFAAQLPAHTLMRRAGLSVARLGLAVRPHAQSFWIACGPGNNGGDGLEAASHLKRWGKNVLVTWLGSPDACSADTLASLHNAREAGVQFVANPPTQFDFAIDALLGIGVTPRGTNPQDSQMNAWVDRLNQGQAPVLAIDLPSGLNANTGAAGVAHGQCVRAQITLSLVTLKPGLFTATGRDHCGDIWFDAIGCDDVAGTDVAPIARLTGSGTALHNAHSTRRHLARHASHKGIYGDVMVVGGAPGMAGAALLAASAALHGGAGRVLVALLDKPLDNPLNKCTLTVDPAQPELMFRPVESLDFRAATVVCGCGGSDAVRLPLPRVLSTAAVAVLDADALNAIATDTQLQAQLKNRSAHGRPTVLTPHPLEAARLLGCTTAEVQLDRLAAARKLAERFSCCVVLKGSGTVVAAPGLVPHVNPSGNALLATAGTGDVLAGLIGARMGFSLASLVNSQAGRADVETVRQAVFQTVCDAVFRHGEVANRWPASQGLTASALARQL